MAKEKKVTTNKQVSPEKTDQVYAINRKNIAVYSFPENTILNGEEYLPLLSEKRIKGRSLVVRREDLMPKAYLQEPALQSNHIIWQTLFDTFTPTYGSASTNAARRFSFLFSKSLFITSNSWLFCNRLERPGEFLQGIIFTISTIGIPHPHLRINFGATSQTGIPDSILGIITPLGNFKINVSPLSSMSLTILLNGPTDTVNLVFRRDENDPNAVCEIESFELYDTILVDPSPVFG